MFSRDCWSRSKRDLPAVNYLDTGRDHMISRDCWSRSKRDFPDVNYLVTRRNQMFSRDCWSRPKRDWLTSSWFLTALENSKGSSIKDTPRLKPLPRTLTVP